MQYKFIDNRERSSGLSSLLGELRQQQTELAELRMLAMITGNNTVTESTRNIYEKDVVKSVLEHFGILDAYDQLFEKPLVPRQAYCRLTSSGSQPGYFLGVLRNLVLNYPGTPAQLERALAIYQKLATKSVNRDIHNINASLATKEQELIGWLNSSKLFLPTLKAENTERKALTLLHVLARYQQNAREYLYINKHEFLIVSEAVYYEQVYYLKDILETFSALGLDKEIPDEPQDLRYYDLFFEKAGPYLVLPRISPLNDDIFYKAFSEELKNTKDENERKTLLGLRKDFKDYLRDIQNARRGEEYERLRGTDKKQLRQDFNLLIQQLAPHLKSALKKGWHYTQLANYIEQTDFTAKGKWFDIRSEINDMYEKYYTAYHNERPFSVPPPGPEIYNRYSNLQEKLPDSVLAFLEAGSSLDTEQALFHAMDCNRLLALCFAYTTPLLFREYKLEFLRQKEIDQNAESLYSED